MWDLIVSVPDHCLSFYFSEPEGAPQNKYSISEFSVRNTSALEESLPCIHRLQDGL